MASGHSPAGGSASPFRGQVASSPTTESRQPKAALAVIIGRAGSQGLPGKNAREIAGRPMICHTIEDALSAETVDRVVVSTDGDAIAAAAESMGVEVIRRPAHLANDTATVDAVVRHAIQTLAALDTDIVILYANVPVRPNGLIDLAVRDLQATGADSVQSYSAVGKHHPYWMVTLDDSHQVRPFIANTVYRRQDLPRLYLPDGGVIAVRRESLFTIIDGQPHAFLGRNRCGIISPGPVVDVDDEMDFAVAEAMLQRTKDHAGSAVR
jgi:CMP-N,N'-diacetyllegionaminic acid synthase